MVAYFQRPLLLLFTGGCIITFVAVNRWERIETSPPERAKPPIEGRLDPNTADWWHLARLPGIGRALAQRIVDYRATERQSVVHQPVFAQPADLCGVSGIGPRKVQSIRRFLRFPGAPASQETPG
jgi:DNA uptake protein ComE-like DNA-binding protein